MKLCQEVESFLLLLAATRIPESVIRETLDIRHKTYAKFDIGREKVDAFGFVHIATDEGRCDDALLTLERPKKLVCKLGCSVSHTERRAPRAILGLHHFIASVLNPMNERLPLLTTLFRSAGDVALRDERYDGDTRVTTHNRDGCLLRISPGDASQEARGADDVKGSDAEELARIEGAGFLEDGGNDGDCGVDGIGDNEDERIGGGTGDGGGKIANDACVGLKGCTRTWLGKFLRKE